ncbi:D-2-hydroxyglutarate dehydrogenase [Roseibacterium elongatum DSM 19469]|uniref:D-2-hydroxyglutarate dehydrogenase n=1 Tax=Roseicyclus elongatus DSM 19469 TaxID=1294273 RepID=W8RXI7_9RHOB|nr:FAD-binding oxidoreductase [Roseibacterium elongatum]AHM02522.1 D-2-hydroxyglutarate dehydrogenase [Roseibacterium elongatum DSM 19469]
MTGILDTLADRLPAAALRPMEPRYLEEPRGRWHGLGAALVAPATTAEVAETIRACAQTGTPVIPYGGGTGLVGGQLAQSGTPPVILSMERMRTIRDVDAAAGTMTVEAGAILAELHQAAEAQGWIFPLTLASQGSARIGGLLATNAGGVNVLRYGNARDLCLGIEAVLPDGTVMNTLSPLRKNNTGYDLRHLLIGAEGTLGVITAATLRLFPKPERDGAALMVVPDADAALALLRMAQARIGEGISAFELIGRMGLDFLAEVGPEVKQPFPDHPAWTCLIDLGLSGGADPSVALEALFAEAFDAGLVTDGVIAQSEGQRQAFWSVRESIPLANRRIGAISSHDISVPVARIPAFIARAPGKLAEIGDYRINCFGHLGDGNLHYNVFPMPGRTRADHESERGAIKRCVHDMVHEMGGSVSAEHGIGRFKVDDLERYGDPGKLAAMRAIKAALDPKGIMNPGAVLRP